MVILGMVGRSVVASRMANVPLARGSWGGLCGDLKKFLLGCGW